MVDLPPHTRIASQKHRCSLGGCGSKTALVSIAGQCLKFASLLGGAALLGFLIFTPTAASAALVTYTWSPTDGGTYSWNDVANWGGTASPNLGGTNGHKANIVKNITGDVLLNLNATITLGALTLEDSGSGTDSIFSIFGNGGTFIFDFGASPFVLKSTLGTSTSDTGHLVTADIQLQSPLSMNAVGPITISGAIREYGAPRSLEKIGTGTLYLTGNNSYTGGTTIDQGVLSVNGDSALGAAPSTATTNITLTGGTLQAGANLTIHANRGISLGTGGGVIDTQSHEVTYAGTVSGSSALTKAGSGLLDLNVGSTHTGSTVIQGGVFRPAILSGGNLNFDDGSVLADANAVYEANGIFNRALGTGAGKISWSANASGGFSPFGGNLSVDLNTLNTRDTINWGGGNFLDSGRALIFGSPYANGIVEWYDHLDLLTGSVAATRTIKVIDNTGSTADRARITGNLTNSGSGAASLEKIGNGVLELAGNNSYKGATFVSQGTLLITGTLESQTSSVTVGNSAVLGGTGTIFRPVIINNDGRLAPGASVGVLSTGDLTLNGFTDIELGAPGGSHTSPGISDQIVVSGNLSLGGTLNLLDNAGANGQGSASAGSYRLFTYTATLGGNFTAVTNALPNLHARITPVAPDKAVYLDLFNYATADAVIASIDLGVIHKNQSFGATALTIHNMAPAGDFTEGLDAIGSDWTGAATTNGSIANLPGGSSSDALSVGLGNADTTSVGIKSGSITLALNSNGTNSELNDTALPSQLVAVSGQVNDYAVPAFQKTEGLGLLTPENDVAASYLLDFGTRTVASTGSAILSLNNLLQSAYQDDLDGTFDISAAGAFNIMGFTDNFGPVAAGNGLENLAVDFAGLGMGTHTGHILFHPTSSNVSSTTALTDIQLNFAVTIVPEPTAFSLLTIFGLSWLLVRLRRR